MTLNNSNTIDPPSSFNIENSPDDEINNETNETSPIVKISQKEYLFQIFIASLHLIAYLLIAITVGILLLISLSNGLRLDPVAMHIVLCAIGYHLLMSIGILGLSSYGWSASLLLHTKRLAHMILMIVGSILGIAGSIIIIRAKNSLWETTHGIFGVFALTFTAIAITIGLNSLCGTEKDSTPRYTNGRVTKAMHLVFGIVAYVAASIAICYGIDKALIRTWATDAFITTLITFTAISTVIVIFNPISFFLSCFRNRQFVLSFE